MAIIIGGVTLVGAPAWSLTRPDRALRVATGLAAETLCAEVFVSGLDPDRVFADSVASRSGLNLLAWGMRRELDRAQGEVRISWLGLQPSRAVFRGLAGCQLVGPGARVAPPPVLQPLASADLPAIAGPGLVGPADAAIAKALDAAFAEPAKGAPRRVRAIVVVHEGRVIAERYAAGVGPDTPLPGYSLTKTALNALSDVMSAKGRLDMRAPAPVAAWRGAGDPRAAITPEQLLRMTSGLDAAETHSGFDPTSRMLYVEPDMAGFAATLPLKAPPGTSFAYQSPNSLILGRVIADLAGGGEAGVLNFARGELFGPLGMTTAVLPTDAAGTPMVSAGMLASARDWAKLGMLFLNDGMAGERRILPPGWVAWSSSQTLDRGYGAGLWLNNGSAAEPQMPLTRAGMPPDAVYGSGDLGQRLYIVPSQRLVVVRLAASSPPDFGLRGDMEMMRGLTAALGGAR